MNGDEKSGKGRVLIVADARCIHAQRPWEWAKQLGYETHFVDTSYADTFRSAQDLYTPYPRIRGQGLLPRLLGGTRGVQLRSAIEHYFLRRLLSKWPPNIVHCHWIGEHACAFAQAGSPNLVLSAWGSDLNQFFDGTGSMELKARVRFALRACRLLLADSEDTLGKAEEIAEKKLPTKLFYLGINVQKFKRVAPEERVKWRHNLRIPSDAFLFCSVRAWQPLNNHHLILEAFAMASKMTNRSLGLLFKVYYPTGTAHYKEYESTVRRRTEELGIVNSVFWAHEVQQADLPGLYSAADAILNFPARDALPVTFFEAAAALRPVVTCQLPAYDITLASKHFHLVNAGDVRALAKAMVTVIEKADSPEMTTRLRSAGEVVESTYSESVSQQMLHSIYQGLIHS